MSTFTIVLLVILAVLTIAVVVLYFLGKRAQKKQAEQQAQIEAMKQTVSMLIIDKKRMKLKDAGLPQAVIDQTPKWLRGSKLPIVKTKVGPQIMSLISRREDRSIHTGQERSESGGQRYLYHRCQRPARQGARCREEKEE